MNKQAGYLNNCLNKFLIGAFIIFLSILSLAGFSFALTASDSSYQPSPYLIKDSLSRSTKEAALSLNAINGLAVDPFTGSANLNIPLSLPPARRGMHPNLILNYSTSNPNGSLGLGWKLDLGYIERSTKDGIPKYTNDDKFIFSLAGNVSELVFIGSNIYLPKRQPENYKFDFDGVYWRAKDREGRIYYFGSKDDRASIERSSSRGTFRWYLVRVEDMLGNYIVINYDDRLRNHGFPSKIHYGRYPNEVYDEIYIEFTYEQAKRQDIISNYRPGFKLTNSEGRLYEIGVWSKQASGKQLFIRRYTLDYGYSKLTNRSLLTKITEWGSDGSTSLPPITFSYQDASEPAYTVTSLKDDSTYFADFNGDGLTDLGQFNKSAGKMTVRLSTGSGFAAGSSWISGFGAGKQLLLGDFNGDGRTDLCAFSRGKGEFEVVLSDGKKFVKKDKKDVWLTGFNKGNPAFVAEINGDGLNDIVVQTGQDSFAYAKSTGRSFVDYGHEYWPSYKNDAFIGEFDGDGLGNLCGYNPVSGEWSIRPLINLDSEKTGFGFVGFGKDKETLPLDVNNDGLTDAGYYDYETGKVLARLFTGDSFGENRELSFTFGLRNKNTKVQTADFNGDGLTDYVVYSGGKIEIAYSKGEFPDLLTHVDNGIGASLDLKYRASSSYTNKRSDGTPGLPFTIPVFYQSKVSDGQGNTYTTTYSYLSGLYDDQEREFAGFGYCRITQDEGSYTEQYYLQDKTLRGKLYKELVKDSSGNTYLKTENIWTSREIHPGVNLVYLKQADIFSYDGDASFKQTRTKYEYDDYGNITKMSSDGDTAITGDEKTIITEYGYNILDWIVGLPSRVYTLDENSKKLSEKRFYYDGADSYTKAPMKGLLTKEETWLYNPLTKQEDWVNIQYEYDILGNLIKTTDSLGQITTLEYDPRLKLYPIKITNPKGQITASSYDYGTGNILTATDANNQTTTYEYDPLGRLIKVIGPLDTEGEPQIVSEYDLSSRPTKITSKIKSSYSPFVQSTSYQFYDGLGRLIQTKAPAENGQDGKPRQVISGLVKFNSQGRVKEKYHPYFASESSSYSPPDYTQPKSTFSYDCLGRLLQTTNPDGTYNSTVYSDWKVTSYDENGHSKTSYLDGYQRVAKIEEHKGAVVYTTTYTYDGQNNLIQLTDNQGNSTYFTYDSLGRKLRVNDPDMGIWDYEYDKAGNLTQQTDAKKQILNFKYDSLNRLTQKLSDAVILATYEYDSGLNGVGRISKVTDSSGSSEYFYDKLGRATKTTKTITGSGAFTIERAYDALGRLVTLTYPDGEAVTYTYNPGGAIESVAGRKTYVSNIDYAPTGQIKQIQYANGVTTDYTYDPDTLRLTNLLTRSQAAKIQDLSYKFDKTGNIQNITDRVNTATQSFLYDDLNRLIQAQGSYGAFTYDYDSLGNLTSKEGQTLSYGQAGSLPHALASSSSGSTFTYDASGNLAEEDSTQLGPIKYSYDSENRLIKVEPPRKQEFSFAVNLKPGWNFISLPVIPQDASILQALKSLVFGLDYDQVSRYNRTTKKWEMWTNQPDFDQFTSIDYGQGYQIYITNPKGATLKLSGTLSSEVTAIPISTGWNLIGFPYWTSSKPVETALSPLTLAADYESVERYNSAAKTVEKYTSTVKQFSDLKQGEAYYLKALKDTTWNIPKQNTSLAHKSATEPTEFVYDYQGNRVKKLTTLEGHKVTTAYIDSLYELQTDNGQQTTTKHIFAGANRICSVTQYSQLNTQYAYYHPDHLGSSNIITDQDGKQAASYEYTPYGSLAFSSVIASPEGAKQSVPYLFTGKELDSTGLYYYGARYYNPESAHFTQPDPVIQNLYDPQALNHYSYARNNPLIYTDPTGMSFDSFNNGFFNFNNSIWNSISSGVSAVGQWGQQVGSQLNDLWRDFNQTNLQGLNTIRQGLSNFGSSIGQGLSNFGQGLDRLGQNISQGLGSFGIGIRDTFTNLKPFGFGTNVGLSGLGEFMSGLGKIETMSWQKTLFVDSYNTIINSRNVLNFGRPWQIAGKIGAGIDAVMAGWDITTTFANSNLNLGQKFLKAGIQVAGAGVTFGVGVGAGATFAATGPGIAITTTIATSTAYLVTLGQEYLYEKWGLQR